MMDLGELVILLKDLKKKATPGKWELVYLGDCYEIKAGTERVMWVPKGGMHNGSGLIQGAEINMNDANLLLASVNALPDLLDTIEKTNEVAEFNGDVSARVVNWLLARDLFTVTNNGPTSKDAAENIINSIEALLADATRYRKVRSQDLGPSYVEHHLFETVNDDCNPPYRSLKHTTRLDEAVDKINLVSFREGSERRSVKIADASYTLPPPPPKPTRKG